jgi:hypothetical protein
MQPLNKIGKAEQCDIVCKSGNLPFIGTGLKPGSRGIDRTIALYQSFFVMPSAGCGRYFLRTK